PLRRRADLPRPAGRGPGPPPGRGGADVNLRRTGRYQLALLLAGVLFLVLVASSALDYLSLDQIPNRGALLGLPAVALIGGAAWGAIVATSLVIWAESLFQDWAINALVPGPGLDATNAFSAGLFEELAKGVAVLLLYLVMRDQFHDVVDGIVYGAAVGLGFNF